MADLTEVSFGSTDLFYHDAHAAIGITDCSLMNLAEQGFLIITDDLPLTATLEKRRFDVVNFSRIIPLDRD